MGAPGAATAQGTNLDPQQRPHGNAAKWRKRNVNQEASTRGTGWRGRSANRSHQQRQGFHHGARNRFGSHEDVQSGGSRSRFASQDGAGSGEEPKGRAQYRNAERKNVGVGFKFLESLCEKQPEDIIVSLSTNKGFSIRLEQELPGDYIVILVKLWSKLCASAFNQCKIEVIKLFCKETFMEQMTKFIALLAIHNERDKRNNQYFWRNPEEFYGNLYVMCNSVIDLIPSTAVEVIPKLIAVTALSVANVETQQGVSFGEITKENFEKLQKKLVLCIEEIERKEKTVTVRETPAVELEPPDNFRDLSVYPTSAEVLLNEKSFLRANKVNCEYRDVEQYLDIQFRLLREDFVGPLREGIGEYLEQKGGASVKKIHTVKVHQRVQFLGTQNARDQVGFRVQFEFDLKKFARRFDKLEHSKRLMYGALVCFTKDNFHSLIFGKIIDRDVKLLKKGIIVVGIQNDEQVECGVNYVMVECNVYFEPYYHVLTALKTMDVDNFPMERYIIKVDRNISPPRYLSDDSTYDVDVFNVALFDPLSWPSAKALSLNDTQYEAFKAGLTKEFCIIQGPPGIFRM